MITNIFFETNSFPKRFFQSFKNQTFVLVLILFAVAPAHAQWKQVSALHAVPIYSLYSEGAHLYAAAADRLYYSRDAGTTWKETAVIHQDDDGVVDVWVADGVIYAAMAVNGIYLSTDDGKTWKAHNTGLAGPGAVNMSMLARRGDSLYAATNGAGVFVKPLKPLEAPWSSFNKDLNWGNVLSITNDRGTLLAGGGINATLSRNEPGSAQWTERPFAKFNGSPNGFLGAVRDSAVLLGGGSQGLYRSDDNGLNWQYFNPGVGLVETIGFARRGKQTAALLLKPNGSFLFSTEDRGTNWKAFSPAPPSGALGLDIAVCNDRFYLARTDGLWVLAPTVATDEATEFAAELEPTAPNPAFDGSTSISFRLRRAADVQILLYDLQGRLLQHTELGLLPAGAHTQTLDLQNLSNGAYVYGICANGRATTRTLQVLR
jgi:photosystem II stability/assembly factor-like uncharacterized protein